MLVQEEAEVTKKTYVHFLIKILEILQIGPGFFTKITNTGSIESCLKISNFSKNIKSVQKCLFERNKARLRNERCYT